MMLPIRPPLIVHHMAALEPGTVPNSLAAIRTCLVAEAEVIEIDATALAAEDFLLVHDPYLESETDGFGPVQALTAAQARLLHCKERGHVTPEGVALLSDVVTLIQENKGETRLQIDWKDVIPFPTSEPYERLLRLIRPLGERVIVSTGADWQLRRLRRLAPWLDLGFDIGNHLDWREVGEIADPRLPPWKTGAYGYWDDHPLAAMRFLPVQDYLLDRCELFMNGVPGLSTFYISHRMLVQSLRDGFNWADVLHTRGIKLDAWTLDTTSAVLIDNAVTLYKAGVDMFTTNTPVGLKDMLDVQHL
ncbi:MAG TPA: glycerophosphodiester phosphodiesterase family protein [Aggregatilineales bacterium]|nr:glycerophosphodiester phosphodiesterase family protein [Aggregatilineales bacterium]